MSANPARVEGRCLVSAGHKLYGLRLVPLRVASLCYELTAEVFFGGEGIVSLAAQREVRGQMSSIFGERLNVMELETTRFAAPFAVRIDIAAATAIAAIHFTAFGRRDVTAALSERRARTFLFGTALVR